MDGDACVSAMLHQRMIELRPRSYGSKDTTYIWQRKFDCSTRGRVHNNVRGDLPVGNARRVKTHLVKDAQGICGESIATTLVSWERSFIHHGHIVAKTMKGGCTCGS
jgi:hypothetical protein